MLYEIFINISLNKIFFNDVKRIFNGLEWLNPFISIFSMKNCFHFSMFFDDIATRFRRGEGFELDVSPGCENLGPGQACLIGCRWPFLGRVVAAQCPVGNTDRFQVGSGRCLLKSEWKPDGFSRFFNMWWYGTFWNIDSLNMLIPIQA